MTRTPAEIERLSFIGKGSAAEILLAIEPEGVSFAASCHRRHGDFCGWAEPLGRWADGRLSRRAADRDSAIAAGSEVIRRRDPDPEVLTWLDSLIPAQPDLFQSERLSA